MYSPWWSEIRRAVLIVGGITLFGAIFSNTMVFLVIGLLVYIAFLFAQLFRFHRWYLLGKHGEPPQMGGIWEELVNTTYHVFQKSVKRKKRIQKLIKELSSFRKALPDATVLLNRNNEIYWCNSTAAHNLGINRKKDIGRKITNLIRNPEFISYLNTEEYEEPLTMNSPSLDYIRLHIQIAGFGSGNKVLSARDVTRMHRLQAMRRDFVGNVSHELRTPLTVIQGYTEILAEDPELPDDKRDIMGRIHQQSERMQSMVEDLLVLNRLETTEPAPSSQMTVDVSTMAEAMANEVRMMPKAANLEIELDISSDARLQGDPNELRSAFFNLLINAIRYSQDGDSIVLRWWVNDNGGYFEVQDTGIGIAPEHLPRLTQRFYRVQEDRSRATGGTGLGLAIVKHILERHDARLLIESDLGEGSSFICEFPLLRIQEIKKPSNKESA